MEFLGTSGLSAAPSTFPYDSLVCTAHSEIEQPVIAAPSDPTTGLATNKAAFYTAFQTNHATPSLIETDTPTLHG